MKNGQWQNIWAGAYLGGSHGAMPPPPLGRQDIIISMDWYARCGMPPFCKFSTKFEHTNGQNPPFRKPCVRYCIWVPCYGVLPQKSL